MEESAQADLALIRRLMEETRGEAVDRGKHFLIWGVVSGSGLVATWSAVTGNVNLDPRWIWAALLAAGWAASMYVGWRDSRRTRVRAVGRHLLSALWVATGASLTLIGVAGLFGDVVDVRALPGLLSTVVAAAFLTTSILMGAGWLKAVAVGWWIGGAAMLFLSGPSTLLVMAGLVLAGMVLPGMILYSRTRRDPHDRGPVTRTA